MKKAFTLVEILVVITIMGILSAVALVGTSALRERGRDSGRMNNINTVASALANYYADNHSYPNATSYDDLYDNFLGPSAPVQYLGGKPQDPKNAGIFIYYYTYSGGNYTLTACFENSKGTGSGGICGSNTYYKLINGEPSS